ncbi:MAG: glycosyltransferase family 2 protein [Chthoniobacterales bacterium]
MPNPSYVVITPVRDEEEHLSATIDSMIRQTITPHAWVIVDDGSSDQTASVAERAAQSVPWIHVIRRANRGFRQPGTGVIAAFTEGYGRVAAQNWDFLVKLDGDLSFDPDYFEQCFDRFAEDQKLGVGGGTICQRAAAELVSEAPGDPLFHVRGATKIYKRECWQAIGGLMQAPGWDTVDEYKANMLGWKTYTFREIKLLHHRHAGGAEGTWKNWVKNGVANYVAGYHPLFMACKCAKRVAHKPYLMAAAGLLTGYLGAWVRGVPKVDDHELIRYVRRQQLRRLFFRTSLWDVNAETTVVGVKRPAVSMAPTKA